MCGQYVNHKHHQTSVLAHNARVRPEVSSQHFNISWSCQCRQRDPEFYSIVLPIPLLWRPHNKVTNKEARHYYSQCIHVHSEQSTSKIFLLLEIFCKSWQVMFNWFSQSHPLCWQSFYETSNERHISYSEEAKYESWDIQNQSLTIPSRRTQSLGNLLRGN